MLVSLNFDNLSTQGPKSQFLSKTATEKVWAPRSHQLHEDSKIKKVAISVLYLSENVSYQMAVKIDSIIS